MARYIDAEKLLNRMKQDPLFPLVERYGVSGVIEAEPTADVQAVRHGEWVGTEFDGYADGNPVYYEWKCSVCGCIFEDDEPTYRYCPNCGAKMDGGSDEQEERVHH